MPKFSVSQTQLIHCPVEKLHAIVGDFHTWTTWSPWLLAEPDCAVTVAEDGKSYSWKGKIVGSGEMEVTSEKQNEAITSQLTFLTPWKSVSTVQFLFSPKDGGTEAIWTMEGSLHFFMFWMKPMMVAWIGMDYRRGLLMLKDYAETGTVPSKLDFAGQRSHPSQRFVGVRTLCRISEVGERMQQDMGRLMPWLYADRLEPAGKPFSIYHKYDMVKGTTEYTIGVPIAATPTDVPPQFVVGELPACDVYAIEHTGPYRHLGNAWSAGMMRARSKVFRQNKGIHPFEIYEKDPEEVPENELVTTVCFPIK